MDALKHQMNGMEAGEEGGGSDGSWVSFCCQISSVPGNFEIASIGDVCEHAPVVSAKKKQVSSLRWARRRGGALPFA